MQLTMFESLEDQSQPSSSGKTYQESLAPRTTPLVASLLGSRVKIAPWNRQGENGRTLVMCLDPKEQSRGEFLMPNISAWPNDASVCSLSQVLETTSIPQRFFLSSTACAGILRRADKRGKQLPPALEQALRSVACHQSQEPSQPTPEG